jgi:hypothetical protein
LRSHARILLKSAYFQYRFHAWVSCPNRVQIHLSSELMDPMPCSRPVDILNTPCGAVGDAVHLPVSMPWCYSVVSDVCLHNGSSTSRLSDGYTYARFASWEAVLDWRHFTNNCTLQWLRRSTFMFPDSLPPPIHVVCTTHNSYKGHLIHLAVMIPTV